MTYIAQGDLNIFAVNEIPVDLEKAPHNQDGTITVAHSETGHHHVIEGSAVRVFNEDEFVSYAEVLEPAKIVHLRSFDTHETVELPAGKYRLTRQREYTPEGFRRAAD